MKAISHTMRESHNTRAKKTSLLRAALFTLVVCESLGNALADEGLPLHTALAHETAAKEEVDSNEGVVHLCDSEALSSAATYMPAVCAARDIHNTVMIGLADRWNSRSMLPMFLGSLRLALGADRHFLVWTFDKRAYEDCIIFHQHTLNCIFGNASDSFPIPADFGTKGFIQLVWEKTTIAASILRAGIGIIAVDIDMIFFKDPFEYVHSLPVKDLYFQRQNLEHGDGPGDPEWVNAGFYYARPTSGSISFIEQYLQMDHTIQEQRMLNDLLSRYGKPWESVGLSWDVLPELDTINHCGSWWFGSNSIHVLEDEFHKHVLENERWRSLVFMHFACVWPRTIKEAYMAIVMRQGIADHVEQSR